MPPPKKILEKFVDNKVFIETGVGLGNGIALAVNLGFKKIYSIEQNSETVRRVRARFEFHDNVEIIQGGSEVELEKLLDGVDEPVVFWLDAHAGKTDRVAPGVMHMPVLKELEAIANHLIKTHVILIDDMIEFAQEGGYCGVKKKQVKEMLRRLFPGIHLYYATGKHGKKEILIASMEKECK